MSQFIIDSGLTQPTKFLVLPPVLEKISDESKRFSTFSINTIPPNEILVFFIDG